MFSCSSQCTRMKNLTGIVTQPDGPAVNEGASNLQSWEGAATTIVTTRACSHLWPWGEAKHHKDFLFPQPGGKKTENICPEPLLL